MSIVLYNDKNHVDLLSPKAPELPLEVPLCSWLIRHLIQLIFHLSPDLLNRVQIR